MTPGARVAAAIEILDMLADGTSVEAVLTKWARGNRFAGSKDRAAIRDHVFDVQRQLNSCAFMGGGTSGRALMIGHLRLQEDVQLDALFSGVGHAPDVLDPSEVSDLSDVAALSAPLALDMPDWLIDLMSADLGEDPAKDVALAHRNRAPVFLRVNLNKTTVPNAIKTLQAVGFDAETVGDSPTALRVVGKSRGLRNTDAFEDGIFELQDASSQAMVAALPLKDGLKVLDYCAGGGGKSLAMADAYRLDCVASDISAARMQDVPDRARRAGVQITVTDQAALGDAQFDVVLIDAPCSGSGTWRRAPQAKWLLTPERLVELQQTQTAILSDAAKHVGPDGILAYGTCSVFACENSERVAQFLAENGDFKQISTKSWMPSELGDGFQLTLLQRV